MNLWTKEIVIRNNKVVEDSRKGVNNVVSCDPTGVQEQVCIFTHPFKDGVMIVIRDEKQNATDLHLNKEQLEHLQRLLEPYMG